MFTVLATVLMVMALGVGAMLMSMGMLVLMFMFVSLSRSMHVFMAMDVFMGMRTLHAGTPFKRFLEIVPPFLESWNTCSASWPPNLAICWPCKRHGVSEVFSTRMALSKRLSMFLEDGSEAGQPVTQPVLPTRRCSTESSAGILISQRWPFSSVRSKKELCCRFPTALLVKPLRIGDLRDFIGVITDHLQLILRERRMVRLPSLAQQALAVSEKITKVLADRQK